MANSSPDVNPEHNLLKVLSEGELASMALSLEAQIEANQALHGRLIQELGRRAAFHAFIDEIRPGLSLLSDTSEPVQPVASADAKLESDKAESQVDIPHEEQLLKILADGPKSSADIFSAGFWSKSSSENAKKQALSSLSIRLEAEGKIVRRPLGSGNGRSLEYALASDDTPPAAKASDKAKPPVKDMEQESKDALHERRLPYIRDPDAYNSPAQAADHKISMEIKSNTGILISGHANEMRIGSDRLPVLIALLANRHRGPITAGEILNYVKTHDTYKSYPSLGLTLVTQSLNGLRESMRGSGSEHVLVVDDQGAYILSDTVLVTDVRKAVSD